MIKRRLNEESLRVDESAEKRVKEVCLCPSSDEKQIDYSFEDSLTTFASVYLWQWLTDTQMHMNVSFIA